MLPLTGANLSCLQVDIYIFEPNGISMIEMPHTLGEKFRDAITVTKTKHKVRLENRSGGS